MAGSDDITAHVAGWDCNRPTHSNQQLGEVLAHTVTTLHDLLNGRRHVSHSRLIGEVAVDHLRHPTDGLKGIVRPKSSRHLLDHLKAWNERRRLQAVGELNRAERVWQL